ncbi:hypothetical protein Sjap_025189 [Stephania japonica]|uniref:LysM domain-containing protein n=1 Tax=Stephania japonica TaxID=461633 RepID=A0AAP0HE00_9MAGN
MAVWDEALFASAFLKETDRSIFVLHTISGDPIPTILNYNPQIPNQDTILADTRLLIPFSCDCINGGFLGHAFAYLVRSGDTYERIARLYYANLTTVGMLERFIGYPASRIPVGATVNVTVNCYCGDGAVSREYGLFVTYPLRRGESLLSVANAAGVSDRVLRDYNRNANFNGGSGVVFVPGRGDGFFRFGCWFSSVSRCDVDLNFMLKT